MRNKRITITLTGGYHIRGLILWAWANGRPVSTMAANIVSARVESNMELIEEMLRQEAVERGVSVEDLKQQILNEAGYKPGEVDDPESTEEA